MSAVHPNSLANLKVRQTPGAPSPRWSVDRFSHLVYHMMQRRFTIRSLGQRAKISSWTCERIVASLHEHRAIHIVEWLRHANGKSTVRVFMFGIGEDAPRPPKLTRSEISQRYKNKQRENRLLLGQPKRKRKSDTATNPASAS